MKRLKRIKKTLLIAVNSILCMVGCNNQLSSNEETNKISQNVISAIPSIPPFNQASIHVSSNNEWMPNHVNINISSKEVNNGKEEYVFISSTEGWKAYIEPIGAGQRSIVLYKTTDGGEHWNEIANSEDSMQTITGGDIFFINSKEGWIIRSYPVNGLIRLYKTLDGGISWELQEVKALSAYSDINFEVSLPVFFSQKDGIMFASCININNDEYVDPVAFITHNGGDTWSLCSKDDYFTWSFDMNDSSIIKYKIIYDKEIWHSTDGIQWEKS